MLYKERKTIKKNYLPSWFSNFQLSDRVPKDNFYRRLKEVLDLHFLYPLTRNYYGESGQKTKTSGQVQAIRTQNPPVGEAGTQVTKPIIVLRTQMQVSV